MTTEIHLSGNVLNHFKDVCDGIRRAAVGDFSGLPENPSWHEVLALAVMIDGYEVASKITSEHIQNFHKMKQAEFEKSGAWSGGVLELWTVLFYYNRQNHWDGYGFDEGERGRTLAMSAYQALRSRLMTPSAVAGIAFKTK